MPNEVKAVKYLGIATIRRITGPEWEQQGIKNQERVSWTQLNGYTVLADKFTPDALRYCDQDDEELVLIYEDAPEEPGPPKRTNAKPKSFDVQKAPEEARTTA